MHSARAIAMAALTLLAAAPVATAGKDTFLPKLRIGEESFFEFYGQLNKGFLVYDDGDGALLYPLVDNSNSSTRFGARAGAPVTGSVTYHGQPLRLSASATPIDQRRESPYPTGIEPRPA